MLRLQSFKYDTCGIAGGVSSHQQSIFISLEADRKETVVCDLSQDNHIISITAVLSNGSYDESYATVSVGACMFFINITTFYIVYIIVR